MIIDFIQGDKKLKVDLAKPIDISIPIKNGSDNPNCYYAEEVKFTTIRSGDFIGSVAEGGSVNYQQVRITPHGNGTHTETYGHLSKDKTATVSTLIKSVHSLAELITIKPRKGENGDLVIRYEDYIKLKASHTDALIIRSLPNESSKLNRQYSGCNPPYLDHKIAEHLNQSGVKHLLVDLPSIDKEVDQGQLLAHRAFWGLPKRTRKECTITELIYVDNEIKDGLYLVNLQVINLELDASPSRPVLFKPIE